MKNEDSIAEKYIRWVAKKPYLALAIALFLALMALIPISHLRLDADLEDLLPTNTPTINAMKETKERYGSSDLFTIAIQMDDPVEIAKIQDEIKAKMEADWKDVGWVQVDRDNSFFVKNALLYVPKHHLERVAQNLRDLQLEVGMERTPFGVDLLAEMDEPQTKAKDRVWFDASIPQELGLPDEAADAFSEFLKPDSTQKNQPQADASAGIPDSLKNRLMGRHSDGTLNGVVQAALAKPSSDTRYVQDVIQRANKIIGPIKARYGAKINIGLEGPYSELEEVKSLQNNGTLSTLISLGMIVLLIVYFFRSLGGVVAILIQVILSCTYTLAIGSLIYGRLNMYTVFVVSILLGMGIDYSIHYMGHTQKATNGGLNWVEAFAHTFKVLLQPMFLAAITTVAGLLTLLAAEFVGFYEFGVIAACGIVISMLSALMILPAFVFIFNSWANIPVLKIFTLPTKTNNTLWPKHWDTPKWIKAISSGSITLLVIFVILIPFIFKAGFEYDFANLRDTRKAPDSGRHVSVALQSNRKSSQPIVALAQSPKTMEALHDTLLHRLTVERDPMLRSFLTLSTFVPRAKQQEERMEIIKQIDTLIAARVFDKAEGDDLKMISKLREMVHVKPFGPTDIPNWALRLVQERDGTYGRIGFIYGSFKASDGLEAGKFQDRYGKFHLNGEDIKLYSSSFIFSDIIRLVKIDSEKMGILIAIVILLTLALTVRSLKLLSVATLSLGLGIGMTIGLMGLFGVKLGPFNLILVPTVLGVSIDNVVYLSSSYQEYGPKKFFSLYDVTGTLVIASVITTIAGYGGMLFTTHMGITSIGKLAVISFSSCLITSLFITPWLCMMFKVPYKNSSVT